VERRTFIIGAIAGGIFPDGATGYQTLRVEVA